MSDKITSPDNARSSEQEEVLHDLQNQGVCNFCQGEHFLEGHPHPVLCKTKYWTATRNRWPNENAVHHILIIYRDHVNNLDNLPSKAWTSLHEMILTLKIDHNIKDATLLLRFGDSKRTGSTVQHLHAQIISGDGEKPVITRVG